MILPMRVSSLACKAAFWQTATVQQCSRVDAMMALPSLHSGRMILVENTRFLDILPKDPSNLDQVTWCRQATSSDNVRLEIVLLKRLEPIRCHC